MPCCRAMPAESMAALTEAAAAVQLYQAAPGEKQAQIKVTVLSPLYLGASAGEDGGLKILWALQESGGDCRQEATQYNSSMDCFCTDIYAVFSGEETPEGWVTPEPEFSVFVGNFADSAATLFTAQRAVDDTVTVLDDALWSFVLEERFELEESEPAWPEEPFSITVVREGRTEVYSGCTLTSQKRTMDKTGQLQVRQGTAQTMTVGE